MICDAGTIRAPGPRKCWGIDAASMAMDEEAPRTTVDTRIDRFIVRAVLILCIYLIFYCLYFVLRINFYAEALSSIHSEYIVKLSVEETQYSSGRRTPWLWLLEGVRPNTIRFRFKSVYSAWRDFGRTARGCSKKMQKR
jgi:hypothetical protein